MIFSEQIKVLVYLLSFSGEFNKQNTRSRRQRSLNYFFVWSQNTTISYLSSLFSPDPDISNSSIPSESMIF